MTISRHRQYSAGSVRSQCGWYCSIRENIIVWFRTTCGEKIEMRALSESVMTYCSRRKGIT